MAPTRHGEISRMLKPLYRETLSEQVAVQIIGMISSGGWKTGEKLPPEANLCRSLAVGRSTLREALKSLAFLGVVETRSGMGTYVAEDSSRLLDRVLGQGLLSAEKDVNDLAEARMCLESETVKLCAKRATDQDLGNLQSIVAKQQQCLEQGQHEDFLQWDLEMHLTIASSSRNMILMQLLHTIRNLLEEYIRRSQQVPGGRETAFSGHLKILEALQQHDPRKASTVMRDHLMSFQRGVVILSRASESGLGAHEEKPTIPSLSR